MVKLPNSEEAPIKTLARSSAPLLALLLVCGCTSSKPPEKEAKSAKSSTTVSIPKQAGASLDPVVLLGADSQFSTFLEFVKLAGLESTISDSAGLTIFVPSNASFEDLGKDRLAALKADPSGALATLLRTHMAEGESHMSDFLTQDGGVITTLAGSKVEITSVNGEVRIGGAKITKSDIEAKHTVIFLVKGIVEPISD